MGTLGGLKVGAWLFLRGVVYLSTYLLPAVQLCASQPYKRRLYTASHGLGGALV